MNYTSPSLENLKNKIYSSYRDNIQDADLADIKLRGKYNKGVRFLLCVININSKYTWVVSLKDKKSITITNVFQNFVDESDRKPNTIWVDQGSEFCNRSL